jgi:hypothetical protein
VCFVRQRTEKKLPNVPYGLRTLGNLVSSFHFLIESLLGVASPITRISIYTHKVAIGKRTGVCCLLGAWVCCLPGDCSRVIGRRAPWCRDKSMARGLERETHQTGGEEVRPCPGLGSMNCLQNICRNILVKFECPVVIKEVAKHFLRDVKTTEDLVAHRECVGWRLFRGIVAHGNGDGRKPTINQTDDNAPPKTLCQQRWVQFSKLPAKNALPNDAPPTTLQ